MSDEPTLILLPGLLCDAALWAAQVEGLADIADVRVADLTDANSMAGLAHGVLREAPERFALAGLSMGGYVAQEIMRQAPQRVTHLALIDTNARADTPEQSENRKRVMKLAEAGKLDQVVQEMLPNLLHPDNLHNPATADVFGQMAARIGVPAFLNQQTAIMNRVDGRADLARVECPTLILCGEQDALTPVKVHEEMLGSIGASAKMKVLADCGHLSPIEQPLAVTNTMRRWLSRES